MNDQNLKPGDLAQITMGPMKGCIVQVAALHCGTDRHGNQICRVERVGGTPGAGKCISVFRKVPTWRCVAGKWTEFA